MTFSSMLLKLLVSNYMKIVGPDLNGTNHLSCISLRSHVFRMVVIDRMK